MPTFITPDSDVERSCSHCGYNLRGLPPGGVCPECGHVVRPATARGEPFAALPVDVIAQWSFAAWTASGCVIALFWLWMRAMFVGKLPATQASFVLLGLAFVWMIAVHLLTPAVDSSEARIHGFTRLGRRRRAARWLQVAWVLAAGLGVLVAFLKAAPAITPAGGMAGSMASGTAGTIPGEALIRMTIIGCGLVGFAGIVVLAIHLAALAEWAQDRSAAAAFNVTAWGIPVYVATMALAAGHTGLIAFVLFLFGLVPVVTFPYALLSLSRSMSWSIKHAHEYRDRVDRQHQRAKEYEREVHETIDRMDEVRDQFGNKL